VFVQGDGITRAGAVPFGDGLTAMQAISAAGGMNTFARRSNVVLMRREKGAGRATRWT
jgi:protein involved in polysaccharide export with SLBB domain